MKFAAFRACARPVSLLAVVLAAVLAVAAQQPAQPGIVSPQDPANLAGEHVSALSLADTLPINHGAPALAQLLLKLRTRASLMLIVAHPDDEDGGMLTYESRGQGARVAMLTLNRGEGGQNLMSGDFDDALGLIRTQELLAADRYMGVDQFFGSVVDFGFSKTREESLEKWGHDRVLYDAVRAVRLYRPLVLTSVFVGGVTDGHGQHQVSGEINQEVFTAAADPNVFPEMIQQGLMPWAPLKVYARAPFARIDAQGMFDYATGKYSPARFYNYVTKTWSDSAPPAAVIVHEGEVSTAPGMDGMSYVQFARKGLALQKSQNGGASRGAGGGAFDSGYARYGSRIPNSPATEQTMFDGIDITLPGIASLAPDASSALRVLLKTNLAGIDTSIANAQAAFTADHPEGTAPRLREAFLLLDGLIKEVEKSALPAQQKFDVLHELRVKRVQCNDALILAHGLTLEAKVASGQSLLTTQTSVAIDARTAFTGNEPVHLKSLTLVAPGTNATVPQPGSSALDAHTPAFAHLNFAVAHGLPATRPYFSRPNLEQPFYDIADPALRNAPATPSPLTVLAMLDDEGVEIQLAATVAYPAGAKDSLIAPNDMRSGEPVSVVPPVSIALPTSSGVLPIDRRSFRLSYTALTVNPDDAPQLRLEAPTLWTYTLPPSVNQPLPTHPPVGRFSHQVAEVLPVNPIPYRPYPVTVVAELDGKTYREGYRTVGYNGIQGTNLYYPSTFHIVAADVHTAPGLRVAYLPGTGDDVAAYLPDLGVTPEILSVADLTPAKLSQFDAVVLGVRAYAAHPELAGAGSQPLLDYAKSGGVVIVQYNTARYGDAEAPFPIAVPGSSDFNVVEEADRVTLLAPGSPLLTWPNHITPADFNGWVAERGHGFARSWASEFHALLETHDPGQDEEKGGLLVARTGKGYYIYTALALYRQLPEGVPGAYRLFANLVSLGKNPAAAK
jgi:LmbE family N-acetylglucosaminyl deacetylase